MLYEWIKRNKLRRREESNQKNCSTFFFFFPFSLPFMCTCVCMFVIGLGEFFSGSTSYSTSFRWQTFWLLGHTVQLENPRLRTYRGGKDWWGEHRRWSAMCCVFVFVPFLFCSCFFFLLPAPWYYGLHPSRRIHRPSGFFSLSGRKR